MSHSLIASRVSNRALIFVLIAQFLCLLPLFLFLPIWMPALLCVSCFWRMQIIKDKWAMPNILVKGCLATGCVAGLYFSYGISISIDPLVGFLVCGVILKVIEAQKIIDTVVIVFVCLVIVAAQLLFSQSIGALLYTLICFVALVGALGSVWGDASLKLSSTNTSGQNAFIAHAHYRYKRASIYVVQALPIAALLFFIMPRLPPLWSMPEAATSASTGFSETMSPGDISQLSKSSKVAFRVSFYDNDNSTNNKLDLNTNKPVLTATEIAQRLPNNKRYWRGLVLDEYTGKQWRRSDLSHFFYNQVDTPSSESGLQPRFSISTEDGQRVVSSDVASLIDDSVSSATLLEYRILLEPHQNIWLFSLNKPLTAQSTKQSIGVINNNLIKSKKKITSRLQYDVRSNLSWQGDNYLSERVLHINTRLPVSGNSRSQALISDWVNKGVSAREISNRILRLYQKSFVYTLNPPLLGDNAIDDFLFVSRRGFCEHFSSAYVYLMRLAGVPARVVVGYLGGRINPIENYMTVRQSDAHAWAEVWFEGEGWVRVDPTAAVAPSRIEQNLFEAIDELEQSELAGGLFKLNIFNGIRNRIDAVSFLWHRYIVEFDNAKQSNLLNNLLGGKTPLKIGVFLLVSMAVITVVFFFLPNLWKKSLPIEIRLLKRFEKKCRKLSLVRAPSETPMEFCQRVADAHPYLKERALIIGGLFNQLLYANNEVVLLKLERAIKYFSPSKRAMKGD